MNKKALCAVVAAILLVAVLSACAGQSGNELVGCWVAKDENGYVCAIQFMSSEAYYTEYQNAQGTSSDNGEYCAEADGTLCLKKTSFHNFDYNVSFGYFDYKVSGKKLTLVNGDETREFTKWDKNIGHIEEHPDWKKEG